MNIKIIIILVLLNIHGTSFSMQQPATKKENKATKKKCSSKTIDTILNFDAVKHIPKDIQNLISRLFFLKHKEWWYHSHELDGRQEKSSVYGLCFYKNNQL